MDSSPITNLTFCDDNAEYLFAASSENIKLWNIRKGVFPAVGGMREIGTTCLIEDVAYHLETLPEAARELQEIIASHGYSDAVIYGHALEGNFHFIKNTFKRYFIEWLLLKIKYKTLILCTFTIFMSYCHMFTFYFSREHLNKDDRNRK